MFCDCRLFFSVTFLLQLFLLHIMHLTGFPKIALHKGTCLCILSWPWVWTSFIKYKQWFISQIVSLTKSYGLLQCHLMCCFTISKNYRYRRQETQLEDTDSEWTTERTAGSGRGSREVDETRRCRPNCSGEIFGRLGNNCREVINPTHLALWCAKTAWKNAKTERRLDVIWRGPS